GGTVIVGVAGFGASIWNTRKTVHAARTSGIWDRRADIYVQALAAVQYRQTMREQSRPQTYPVDDQVTEKAQVRPAASQPPDWNALDARLRAFASETVVAAMQDSSTAHTRAVRARASWEAAAFKPGADTEAKFAPVTAALKAAENADDTVIDLIRTELQ